MVEKLCFNVSFAKEYISRTFSIWANNTLIDNTEFQITFNDVIYEYCAIIVSYRLTRMKIA